MEYDSDDSFPSLGSPLSFEGFSDEGELEDKALNNVCSWYKLDADAPPPAPPSFPFQGKPGIKVPTAELNSPVDYFNLFFNEDLISCIVSETNRFAEQYLEGKDLTPSSRSQKWIDTNNNEIMLFISVMIYEGIVQKPLEQWYWSRRHSIHTPIVGEVMPYNRYQLLMKYLHFSNNESLDASTHPQPRLRKIYKVFQILNKTFQNVYVPERNIMIDESLVPFNGRLRFKQYMPTEKARFGIKIYQLCESSSGYIYNMLIHTGKDTPFNPVYGDQGIGTKCVMSLLENLLGKGYCLCIDNFFSSPELTEILISQKTDVYGTICPNRKNLPPIFKTEKSKDGKPIAFQKGKMCILKWEHKNSVNMISTIHNNEMVDVTKGNITMKKPKVVVDYNKNMEGIDKSDQCMAYYPIIRDQQRKYYKKLFRHLIEQVIWNSYVLYKKNGGTDKQLEFRLQLFEGLVKKHHSPRAQNRNGKTPLHILRLHDRHFPSIVQGTGRKNNHYRRCVVCCNLRDENGKKKRKESKYECTICNVGLCAAPCFEIYHTRENF